MTEGLYATEEPCVALAPQVVGREATSAVSFTNPLPLGVKEYDVKVQLSSASATSSWAQTIRSRMESLLNLGENWNGYGERQIHPASVKRAFALLDQMSYSGPAPAITPRGDGGIQMEWHNGEQSIEVVVLPQGAAEAWKFSSNDEETTWIASQRPGLQRLSDEIQELLSE